MLKLNGRAEHVGIAFKHNGVLRHIVECKISKTDKTFYSRFCFACDDVMMLDLVNEQPKKLFIKIKSYNQEDINEILSIASEYKGDTPLCIFIEDTKKKMMASKNHWIWTALAL